MYKKEILKYLIEGNAFASSPSAFARLIGYSGSATVQRLLRGENDARNDERAVDSVWEKAKSALKMDDEDMVTAFRVMYCSDMLYGELKKNEKEWLGESWGIKSFVALLKRDFSIFTDDFRKGNEFDMKNALNDEPHLYYKVIVGLYLKLKGVDLYRRGRFTEVLTSLIDSIDAVLRGEFDRSNTEGQKMAERLKAEQQLESVTKHKYGAICYLTALVMQYAAPNEWLKLVTNSTEVYDWGWISYWIKPLSSPKKGEEFWGLLEAAKDGSSGFYNLYHCFICNDHGDADCDAVYRVMFQESKDSNSITICTLPEMYKPVKQEIRSYKIKMDEDHRRMEIFINDDNLFGLPTAMKMYNHAVVHEERNWASTIEHYKETNEEKSQRRQVALAGGVEILDFEDGDYKIEDVFVGRESLVIKLYEAKSKAVHYYSIKRDSHDMLSHITPDDDILICKHIGDEKVYVEWATPSFFLALEEFEEIGGRSDSVVVKSEEPSLTS